MVAIWGTPAWANGGAAANVPPRSAATFARFARAAAERFPWVRRWIVWNEPNQRRWLQPPSPVLYVTRLLNPAAAAIKSVIPRASIAGGATAPRGSTGRDVAGRLHPGHGTRRRATRRVRAPPAPALARRDAVHRGLRPVHDDLDGDAGAAPQGDPRGVRLAHADLADRARLPDEPSRPHPRGVVGHGRRAPSPRRSGARTPRAASISSSSTSSGTSRRLGAWQSGLETVSGRRKPASVSFSLPLVQVSRRGQATMVWGQVQTGVGSPAVRPPATGRGRLEEHRVRPATTPGGFFTRTVRADRGAQLRLFDPATLRASPTLVVT